MIAPRSLACYAKTQGLFRPLRAAHNFTRMRDRVALLWGDEVYVIAVDGATATVSAHGHHLEVPTADLTGKRVLSLYQIDCGQGDAALVNFPDGRWMMVDGGPAHDWSNSGKIAADFLYWKMFMDQSWKQEFDFQKAPLRLDAVVCTHPDYDHFGGLTALTANVRGKTLEYGTVYHCGLGRFNGDGGEAMSQLGPLSDGPERFVTTLLDGFDDVDEYTRPTPTRPWTLAGSYGTWLGELRQLQGDGVEALQRVCERTGHLPGFAPAGSDVAVRVLGPIEETHGTRPALRYLDAYSARKRNPSLTRNGHSVVLRLDYRDVRILLTGDLNFRSQALLLGNVDAAEFQSHVAKACHHGSEDISWTFLKAISPLATMISSGDNEVYAHPRAKMLGLTGAFGALRARGRPQEYLGLKEERYIAPLIYSTELSRSVELFPPHAVFNAGGSRIPNAQVQARGRTRRDGGRRAKLGDWLLADRMVYGLINVRTDGERIVMAVKKEGDSRFQIEELAA
jgi:beta-lactamase superfamily II metal-dependent hydrolase